MSDDDSVVDTPEEPARSRRKRKTGVEDPPAPEKKLRASKALPEDGSVAPLSRGQRIRLWAKRLALGFAGFWLFWVILFSFVPPITNVYQISESWRLGGIKREWVSWDEISPHMGRAAVAAEDANFCNHWGFDLGEIRKAIERGSNRGASTITQQVVKNVFLWPDRSWLRKALEAGLTPVVELFWSKERILEVYLNIAEFDEGVFGIEAAAMHYFGVHAHDLSALQAARLAAILPDPKHRSASKPTDYTRKRTRAIMSGADTIAADGRAGCFAP